jgi:hypothetical protein
VDDTGRIVREVKVASEPEAILKVLENPAYRFKRIGQEAGPLSQWLFSVLAEAGLPVSRPFEVLGLNPELSMSDDPKDDSLGLRRLPKGRRPGLEKFALDQAG